MLKNAVVRYWAIGVAVLCASLAAVTLHSRQLPVHYTASSVVSLSPRPNAPAQAALVALLASKYVAFASGDSLKTELTDRFEVPPSVIEDGLAIKLRQRTTNVTIEMSSLSPKLSGEVASAVSTQVANRAASDPYLQAQVIVPASRSGIVERTGRGRLLAVGVIASGVFSLLTMLFVDLLARARRQRRGAATTSP